MTLENAAESTESAENKEFDFNFELKDGKVVISAKYEGKGVESELINKVKPEYFIEKLKKLIPGDGFPEMALDLISKALLK